MNKKTLIHDEIFDIKVDISVYNNLTIITGDSGVGKTFLFDSIKTLNKINKEKIIFFNIDSDIKLNVDTLSKFKGYIIFIDNADILLDDITRNYIRHDENNYYLIMGRDTRLLNASVYRLAYMKVTENSISLDFPFIEHFLN